MNPFECAAVTVIVCVSVDAGVTFTVCFFTAKAAVTSIVCVFTLQLRLV